MNTIITIVGSFILGGISGKLLAQTWSSFLLGVVIFFKAIKHRVLKKNMLAILILFVQAVFFNLILFLLSYANEKWIGLGYSNLETLLFWISGGIVFLGSLPLMVMKLKNVPGTLYKEN